MLVNETLFVGLQINCKHKFLIINHQLHTYIEWLDREQGCLIFGFERNLWLWF